MNPALAVAHAAGEYPVYIEPGVLGELPALVAEHLGGRRIAFIADSTVAGMYREYREGTGTWGEKSGGAVETTGTDETGATGGPEVIEFTAGEESKARGTWSALTDALLDRGYGRRSGIVALGGGVTGDLAGFVAATYMRGVPLLQVPTTLLAMVDASVGGKVGVNTPHGKNLVGAFHPPVAVVIDPLVLRTLPDRELRSGLAEAVKHALVADEGHFAWIEANAAALVRRDIERLLVLIRRSVAIKAEVVAADERERGRRAILNAGHTVAHALEQATRYALPHGEAVALGLVAECALGERLGVTAAGTGARVGALLERLGLSVTAGPIDTDRVIRAMARDKKNRDSAPAFALVERVGRPHPAGGGVDGGAEGEWTVGAEEEAIRAAVESLR